MYKIFSIKTSMIPSLMFLVGKFIYKKNEKINAYKIISIVKTKE